MICYQKRNLQDKYKQNYIQVLHTGHKEIIKVNKASSDKIQVTDNKQQQKSNSQNINYLRQNVYFIQLSDAVSSVFSDYQKCLRL